LIANDAKVNGKTDDDGYTPLDLAIKNKRDKIVDLLRKHGGKTAKEMKSEGR
jgi:ankyrin repeat protein